MFFSIDGLPASIIVTDDPLRAKMLVAHQLENAELIYEQGDELAYLGGYKGAPIAVASVGFEPGAAAGFLRELKGAGSIEVLYIGGCIGTTEAQALRTVVLAQGGSNILLSRARSAAQRYGIKTTVEKALPHGGEAGSGAVSDEATSALYEAAKEKEIEALSVLTVSENIVTGEKMEEHEIRSRFYAAARLVFETFAVEPVG